MRRDGGGGAGGEDSPGGERGGEGGAEGGGGEAEPAPLSVALGLPPPWSAPTDGIAGPAEDPAGAFTLADACQIVPSLLVASAALALTGGLLDAAQHWSMFERRTAYFIAMPMLFGLKGNLDMTLASRLSSALHAGVLERPRGFYEAGMALVMVQAIVCGLVAGVLTVIMAAVSGTGGNSQRNVAGGNNSGGAGVGATSLNTGEALAVVASVMLASMVAAFVFGLLTFGLVFVSVVLHLDSDNFATPLVSSAGDMATLVILACAAYFIDWFADWGGLGDTAPIALIGFGLAALPLLWRMAAQDKVCREALVSGWFPILASLGISQFAGSVLETTIVTYPGIGIFVLFVNGIGGSLSCVYASRLSSALHAKSSAQGTTTVVMFLMLVGVIFQGAYVLLISALSLGHGESDKPGFSFLYVIACAFHVAMLLGLTRCWAPALFSRGVDPDNVLIPILTALADLAGSCLLWVVFALTY